MALMDFDGHVAVIVDSGTGVGSACANLLLERKAKVLVNISERNNSRQDSRNGEAVILHSTPADAIQHALSQYGKVDSVLFMTPTYVHGEVQSGDYSRIWTAMRAGDLDDAFQCIKAVWPAFRRQSSGRVVFANITETPTMASSASLFALLGFAQTLSLEGAKYNIAANVVTGQTPRFTTGVVDSAHSKDILSMASALIPMLLDSSSSDHSGGLFEITFRGASRLRWERSYGAFLNPEKNFTPGTLAYKWPDANDFSRKSFPSGPADFQSVLTQTLNLPENRSAIEPKFDGKTAIITGASAGLGRCYALAFARLGARVVLNDLNDPMPVVEEIKSFGGKAIGCQASCEEGGTIVAAAVAAFGGVDILINNAGFLRDRAFVNMDPEMWKVVLDVHVNGTYQMTQAAWPYLAKHGHGVIVNTSSTSGIYGVFGQANYAAAKLGILGLSEASAREGRQHGIRVNTIAPVAATGALAAAWANVSDKNKGLALKPEYNVPAVLMLCSDSINGRKNTVTGGLFEIGCGWHAATRLRPVSGLTVEQFSDMTPESVARDWKTLSANVSNSIELRKSIQVVNNEFGYTHRDIILYNLSVGAVRSDLSLVYEGSPDFEALPTFGIIPFFSREVITHHGELLPNFDLAKSVLGEHSLEIFQYPIPTSARLRSTGKVLEVQDKGNAALVRTGYTTYDANTGRSVFYNEVLFFAGGAGGFTGHIKAEKATPPVKGKGRPARAADIVVQHITSPEQAALYRLNGDYEALHIDPETSKRSGFQFPILHGHCTLGIASKYVFHNFGRIRRITARFTGPVIPGNTLKIEMWREDKCVLYRVSIVETGKVCISDSWALLFENEGPTARM